MVNRGIILLICVLPAIAMGCFASSNRETSSRVPGLLKNDEEILNGVWEEVNMLETQAKADRWKSVRSFSWGKGRVSPMSLIIDLSKEQPEIQLIGVYWVDVLRVSKPEPHRYIFQTRNKYASNPELRNEPVIDKVDIIVHSDGTITCISSLEASFQVSTEEQYHFFRTYGPGISQ